MPPPPGVGYPPAAYPPPAPGYYHPTEPAQSAHGLAKAAMWLAGVLGLFEVVEAALAWHAQGRILEAARNGESLGFMTPYDVAGLAWYGLAIAAYVVTCLWLYRVRVNAEVFRPMVHHARSRGWVWGAWVCPVVNFWFPYQIVRDVSTDERGEVTAPRINAWWTFWLLAFVIEWLGIRIINAQAEVDPEAYSGLGTVETLNATFSLVALVLWFGIVRRITRDQDSAMGITR